MKISVHQPNFFPWPGFFYKMLKSDTFVFLDHVQFTSRSYINRVKILIQKKPMWITIPITKKKKPINFCKISNFNNWKKKLISTIYHNYSKSPKFSLYYDEISNLINLEEESLCKFNFNIINYFVKKLEIETILKKSSNVLDLMDNYNCKGSNMIVDICKKLNAHTYLSGDGSFQYDDKTIYKSNNLRYELINYEQKEYPQFNCKEFYPGLSILDLLFNIGFEEVKKYLRN